MGIFTVKMRGGHIYGNYCTPASDHFFQQLKQNLEKYRLLRDEVLDIYDHIRSQVAEDKFTKDFGKQEKDTEADYERVEEALTMAIAGHQASLTASTSSAAETGGAGGLPAPQARAPPWKIQTMFQPKDSLKLDSIVGEFLRATKRGRTPRTMAASPATMRQTTVTGLLG